MANSPKIKPKPQLTIIKYLSHLLNMKVNINICGGNYLIK